jgi:N-carbamoylputrescine amidase
MKKDVVKVAMVQMGSDEDKHKNIEKALKYSDQAVSKGADIIAFNELFTTPYFPATEDIKYFDYAETEDGETINLFKNYAKKNKVFMLPTIFEEDKNLRGTYYDTAVFIDKDGEVRGKYRKIHIPQLNGYYEKYYFHPGAGYPVINLGNVKVGTIICYDRHFQEGPRILALKGADIVFAPSTTNFYPETWELELRAHAAFNTIFFVGLNRTEEKFNGKTVNYLGKSTIADPSGKVIQQMTEKEGVSVTDLDLNLIRIRRRKAPFLTDRKIIAYRELVDTDVGKVT